MRNLTCGLVAASLLLVLGAHAARAQCTAGNLVSRATLEKRSLVIDVRPDEINKFAGKKDFRNQAHFTLVNMNPFLFSYKIKVEQTEIQDTGFLNFLNLLGFPVSDLVGSAQKALRGREVPVHGGSLPRLINRTAGPVTLPSATCPDQPGAEAAIKELNAVRHEVLELLGFDHIDPATNGIVFKPGLKTRLDDLNDDFRPARAEFLRRKDTIFDANVEAVSLCNTADELLRQFNLNPYPAADSSDVKNLQRDLENFKSLILELKNSAQQYLNEYPGCPARAAGLGYATNLGRLGDELEELSAKYEAKLTALVGESNSYDTLKETIARLDGRENELLQKEYTVLGQYDLSDLDIFVTPEPLKAEGQSARPSANFVQVASLQPGAVSQTTVRGVPVTVVGDVDGESQRAGAARDGVTLVRASAAQAQADSATQGVRVFAPHRGRAAADEQKPEAGGGDDGKVIRAKSRIGARRFELSGGMVFSALDRREFQPVIGFRRNEAGEIVGEDGEPTDERELTKIVGLSEDSGRRFSPVAMLHTRFPYTTNFYFSVGITGKKDDAGLDLEYLLGPSFRFKNMFFTAGGYAGRQQRLAGDLFMGAPIEGDSVPVRKEFKWGPGFSFTYRIPLGGAPKKEE